MSAMNVAGLQAQLAAPAPQAESSVSAAHSAGARSARDSSAAGKSDSASKSDSANGASGARARTRTRSRGAASESSQPQWLHVMSQAMAAGEPRGFIPGAAFGGLAADHAQSGDADGEAEEVGAVSGDAARRAGAFPADLSAMQGALALVPGGAAAALPVLGKAANAALGALREGSEDTQDDARANETAQSGSAGGVPMSQSKLPNLANLVPQSGDRAANADAQPSSVARLTERVADGARQEAASAGADSGARSTDSAQPVSAATGNGWGALSALQGGGTTEWAPVALKGDAQQGWQGQLMDALGERVEVQMKHGIDNATIRLDPPMLGSVQIDIRHENGVLQVHLVATHDEVARQLQTISSALQNELAQKQYTDVAVVVRNGGSMGQGEEGRGQPRENDEQRAPGRALDDAYASGTEHNNAGA
ncbi:flagellar hook-length control protein FliK [Trinickia sp. YCB016]